MMIERKKKANGFEYLEISNKAASAKIALQGAHLFHYEQVGCKPLLWLSDTSFFEQGRAIRGGVPICWPWFGRHPTNPDLPQHGFARVFMWELVEVNERDADTTEVTLQLKSSTASRKLWAYTFELLVHITVGRTLSITLLTKNRDEIPFTITSALHSYFAVLDIDDVQVEGLADTAYLDALTGENNLQQGNVSIAEEVDRIYQRVRYPLTLHGEDRTTRIDGLGSVSAVVWNPWIDKCTAMIDMPDNGYETMLCIETANALEDAREIGPGEEHALTVVLS